MFSGGDMMIIPPFDLVYFTRCATFWYGSPPILMIPVLGNSSWITFPGMILYSVYVVSDILHGRRE